MRVGDGKQGINKINVGITFASIASLQHIAT